MKSRSSASIASGSHLAGALRRASCHQTSRPTVISRPCLGGGHTHQPLHHEDVRDRGTALHRLVGKPLERDDLAPAIAAVRGDQEPALGVVDPVAERLGGKAAEHHAVHRSDPGAGQHGDGSLRDHRQIDGHPIAALDAEGLEGVGGVSDLASQVPVRHHPPVAGLTLPDQGGLVATGAAEMPVEAVGGDVELPAHEPLGVGAVPFEHPSPGLDPVQRPSLLRPERLAVVAGLIVERRLRDRITGEPGGWREAAVFGEEGARAGRS